MENPARKSFLESDFYQNPNQAFNDAISSFTEPGITEYFQRVRNNPKKDAHQTDIQGLLDSLIQEGKNEKAGLLFNLHRIFTKFNGYDASAGASSDVKKCFSPDQEIPEMGVIVVDFFVTRNLPKVVELCAQRGVDFGRIRVCAPKAVLAAQLATMTADKKREFETACKKLREDQFIIPNVNHNADIETDEAIAIWFSPRTMPITPKLHAETEKKTIDNYVGWFRKKMAKVVDGGRVFANLAFSEEFKPLQTEIANKNRRLTKLTGISENVATRISKVLLDELGFEQLGQATFNPDDVNPDIDHAKIAKGLHLKKVSANVKSWSGFSGVIDTAKKLWRGFLSLWAS
jgi:hypothetical protein